MMLWRLRALLLGWGTVGLIYQLSAMIQQPGKILPLLYVDNWFAFTPEAIWGYLSFFIIVPLGFLACPANRVTWLRQSMQATAIVAGCIYICFPTTISYPALGEESSLAHSVLYYLILIDSPQNCLPSLHMALTTLVAWAMSDMRHKWRSLFYWLWWGVIACSILQLRRHIFLDLLSGTALAILIGYFYQRRMESSQED